MQYRLVGNYRLREAVAGPGFGSSAAPSQRRTVSLVPQPMYLGHLFFLAGLAFALDSWLAAALFSFHRAWFDRRVREDEARLSALFSEIATASISPLLNAGSWSFLTAAARRFLHRNDSAPPAGTPHWPRTPARGPNTAPMPPNTSGMEICVILLR